MKIDKYIPILRLLALCLVPVFSFASNIKIEIERPVIPVLVSKQINPTIKIRLTRADSEPYVVQQISLDLLGTTELSDIASLAIYGDTREGLIDPEQIVCQPLPVANNIVFDTSIKVDADTFSLWVSVTLKQQVSLDHRIQVNCRQIKTTSGNFRVRNSINFPLRVGVAVRQRGQDGVVSSRIPGLATTNNGTLLAIFDARYDSRRDLQGNIDIALHKSTDRGMTWSPMQTVLDMGEWGGLPQKYNGVSDACILVDKNTNDIYVAGLWMHGVLDENGKWREGLTEDSDYWMHQWKQKGSQPGFGIKETCQFLITKSVDEGNTWSFPDNITQKTKKNEWWLLAPAPGRGITLSDGTLLFPTQGRDKDGIPYSNITYSKDNGLTWNTSNPAYSDVTECNAVQLETGEIMLNMRDNRNRGTLKGNGRRICVTSDLGKTWMEHSTSRKALLEPTCMGSLHKHEYTKNGIKRSIMLFANPNNYDRRDKMTLKVSYDDGMTWPDEHWILFDQYKSSGYSSITSIDENSIGIFYESSQAELAFIKINLDELLK